MLRCDTMSSSQEPLVLFGRDHHLFLSMTFVCRQRNIRRKICPRDQSLREVRDQCEMSKSLKYTLRQPLVPNTSECKVSNSHTNIFFDVSSEARIYTQFICLLESS